MRTNSAYPAPLEEMRLSAIPAMFERWGLEVGLSDHTLGWEAAAIARALGASLFEKHLTLRRADGGPDSSFSAEPNELRNYVRQIRQTESILGEPNFGPSEREAASLHFRPSLRVVVDIPAGAPITRDNVKSVRPSGGLSPDSIRAVIGQKAVRHLSQGEPLREEDLQNL